MRVGTLMQLTATAFNKSSEPLTGLAVTWEVERTSVVTVNPAGFVIAKDTGTTTVRARIGDQMAELALTVEFKPCAASEISETITTTHGVGAALAAADCAIPTYGNADGYRIVVTTPTNISVRVFGPDLTPRLLLARIPATPVPDQPLGEVTHEIFGSEPGDTITLGAELEPGSYAVWVLDRYQQRGSYLLFTTPTPLCSAATVTAPIAADEVVNSFIEGTECRMIYGAEAEGYTFTLDSPSAVRFDLKATEFLPRVVITDTEMREVDSSSPLTDSTALLEAVLPPGQYIAWATTYTAGLGPFQLTRSALPNAVCGTTSTDATIGSSEFLALTSSDCILDVGYYADPRRLTLATDMKVRIVVQSLDFDPLLQLAYENGSIFHTNSNGTIPNSAMFEGLLYAGTYTILPGNFTRNATGNYSLFVFLSPP